MEGWSKTGKGLMDIGHSVVTVGEKGVIRELNGNGKSKIQIF